MTLAELLPYLNLLLLPGLGYIINLERKLTRLEVTLSAMSQTLGGHMTREENMLQAVINRKG